jgi:hypothetical protein
MDFFPLFLLFAISVTGLALTVSQVWLRGQAYSFIAILHAITVVAGLHEAGAMQEAATCARCRQPFASRMHLDDLTRKVLPQVGFNYRMGDAGFWQSLCPACKRKTIATAQLRTREDANG